MKRHFVRACSSPYVLSAAAACSFAIACGGSSREAAPARAPAAEPAYAPAEESEATKKEAPGAPPAEDRASGGQAAPAAPQSAPLPSSSKGNRGEPSDDLDVLGRRLEGALSLAAPDCTLAWSLRDRICDLADRLCDLAGRSADKDVAERCSDGRARCERATSRVRDSCGR